jgi:hypothetical protein
VDEGGLLNERGWWLSLLVRSVGVAGRSDLVRLEDRVGWLVQARCCRGEVSEMRERRTF